MMGFSQGCIMVTTLTAMLLKQTGKVPWKLNVIFLKQNFDGIIKKKCVCTTYYCVLRTFVFKI